MKWEKVKERRRRGEDMAGVQLKQLVDRLGIVDVRMNTTPKSCSSIHPPLLPLIYFTKECDTMQVLVEVKT